MIRAALVVSAGILCGKLALGQAPQPIPKGEVTKYTFENSKG